MGWGLPSGGHAFVEIPRASGRSRIVHRRFGPRDGSTILTIRELGSPSIAWARSLIEGLTRSGADVVVFDHATLGWRASSTSRLRATS